MPEGDLHSSTMPGFRGTRDSERAVTRSRSKKKKKQVEFEDVQPQSIPNPTQENFPRRCITHLPDEVGHIYYTGKELTNRDSMRVHDAFTIVFKVWKEIAAILLTFVVPNGQRHRPAWISRGVADLDSAAQYDWGCAILASLYHGLDTAVTTGGAITRFVQLLTFYKYYGVGHPILIEEVKFSAYPSLRAWERGNMRKTNDQSLRGMYRGSRSWRMSLLLPTGPTAEEGA
ncbi:hypothetical protein GIB67_026685 [Kingdonia uniflora]|uniref:Aminotransferase-like plant mobile domain-containing protein n=1 Tax=Kingdonia uniflora TaxID=39325 RepID=A0A7J7MGP4_9MAGN|nr:hypothetical protein GIB67_026685 [Kingdonia uniflora]